MVFLSEVGRQLQVTPIIFNTLLNAPFDCNSTRSTFWLDRRRERIARKYIYLCSFISVLMVFSTHCQPVQSLFRELTVDCIERHCLFFVAISIKDRQSLGEMLEDSTMFELAGDMLFPASPASTLARHMGLSRQYVTKMINGKAPVPPSLWRDLLRLTEERQTHLRRWIDRLMEAGRHRRAANNGDRVPLASHLTNRDFEAIAIATFGENWTGCMASSLDMSPEYMRKLAKGQRQMHHKLWDRLVPVCADQLIQLKFIESELFTFQYPEEIACDWAVNCPISEEENDDGAIKALMVDPTVH